MTKHHNQFTLLKERRFLPYFLTQFLGAFNDNVFKNALIILLAYQTSNLALSDDSNTLINLSAGLFILPFFLFSATSGQLADKYEKSLLIRLIKLLEIIIMIFAAIGFYLNNVHLLMGVLFLMGTHSTLFGPTKYGILPQHLKPEELIGGNGLVEMGTFLAILLGTITGGVLISIQPFGPTLVSITAFTVACLGYLASRSIPLTPSVDPNLRINWNPITETWHNLTFVRGNRTILLAILGISWFWFFGGIYLAQLPNYTKLNLGSNEHVVTLLLTAFSLGIGIGSLLCERLSGHKVEVGLVPFGAIGITLFSLDLSFAYSHPVVSDRLLDVSEFLQTPGSWRVLLDIVLMSTFGGVYIVPLYALIQQRSDRGHVSRVIASNNIINALLMVLSAILAIVFLKMGFTIPQLFLLVSILNALVALYIFTLVPEFIMRFLIWLLIHTLYRVETKNLDKLPEAGASVLVCNHVSYLDALVIAGCASRPVRFVMHYKIYQLPVLNFIFRTAKAIPIAGVKEDKEMLEQAFQQVSETLQAGELVCIFPEGRITNNGEIQRFLLGISRIIETNPVPVIPMALCGMWGTFFSRQGGAAMSRFPRRLWSKIALVIGDPVPPNEVSARGLYEKVLALRGDWK
jgi:hypothetical protein